jgi:tetratricopeptide (TPR) repeat protein
MFLVVFQSPQDAIRKHYEAAESYRTAGNLPGAEAEFAAILAEGYLKLGKIHSTQGQYKEATEMFDAALSYRPDSEAVLVELAIAHFGAGQYEKGIEPLRRALAHNPQNVAAHHVLGKTYFMLGDSAKATSELETAMKLTPHDVDLAYTLGVAYLVGRKVDSARQLFDKMLTEFGDQPQLHIVIGRAYRESGLLPEAIAEFRKAIALDRSFPRAHYYLGLTYMLDEGEPKLSEALEEFKTELAANPNEYLAHYYLGIAYIVQRQWNLAIASFEKASAIQPSNPDPYFQLGQAYQELAKHEQAIAVLRKSIELNPSFAHNKYQVTTAHHRLAQSLLKIGQAEAGQKELQLASDLKAEAFKQEQESYKGEAKTVAAASSDLKNQSPVRGTADSSGSEVSGLDEKARQELKASEVYYTRVVAAAHNNIGLLRAERQDFRAAAQQFVLAAKLDPQQEGVDYNLGLAYYKSEWYQQAVTPLEKELKAHPGNRPAMMLLGLSWFRLGNHLKAAELLSSVSESQSTDTSLYYALASSLIKLRKVSAADRVIEQLKSLSNDGPLVRLLLAEKYHYAGTDAGALAELNKAVTTDGTTPLVHYYAGLLFMKLNKREDAQREFEKELTLNPHDAHVKYSLGVVLLAGREVERGLVLLREVIQTLPENATARCALGRGLLQRGDIAGAIENLERASQLEPEEPEFHAQLGQAYLAAGRKADGKNQIDISKQLRSRGQTNSNDR